MSIDLEKKLLPDPPNIIPVAEFFKERSIFVTGFTGFIGKTVVEKLLWSCEEIDKVYVLIRSKKNSNSLKRLEEAFQLPVFDRLKEKDPKLLNKIIPISGDVGEIDLGICEEDKRLLESVSVVIHAASSVRFNDSIKEAVRINVRGTREIMKLAKTMKNLKVFTYVSTCYCDIQNSEIEERTHKSDYDWKMMIEMTENRDDHILNIIERKIIEPSPNTYSFTKALAEDVVQELGKEIRCMIIRPSIVLPAISEPTPGWVESMNSILGMTLVNYIGLVHVLLYDSSAYLDYVPVDLVTNAVILSTWYKGISEDETCEVINSAAGSKNTVAQEELYELAEKTLELYPPNMTLWYPSSVFTNKFPIFYLFTIFTQILPGMLIDIILKFKGIKFSVMRIYRKVYVSNVTVGYFVTNEWDVLTDKLEYLSAFMTEDDKKMFNHSMANVENEDFVKFLIFGLKKFMLKEDMSEKAIAAAKKVLKRKYWMHQILRWTSFGILICSMLWLPYYYFNVGEFIY